MKSTIFMICFFLLTIKPDSAHADFWSRAAKVAGDVAQLPVDIFKEGTGRSEAERTQRARDEAHAAEDEVAHLEADLRIQQAQLDTIEQALVGQREAFDTYQKKALDQLTLVANHICSLLERNLMTLKKSDEANRKLAKFIAGSERLKVAFSKFALVSQNPKLLSYGDQATLKLLLEVYSVAQKPTTGIANDNQLIEKARALTQVKIEQVNRLLGELHQGAQASFASLEQSSYVKVGQELLSQTDQTTHSQTEIVRDFLDLLKSMVPVLSQDPSRTQVIEQINSLLKKAEQNV